jgi:hypothetical protein
MKEVPRGIRNNNPCNMRWNDDTWIGLRGSDADGYCIFDTPAHGMRAATVCLRTYQGEHHLFTIGGMIGRWAPREDDNDTATYIHNVCMACGVQPDALYPLTPVRAVPMIAAMIRQECGENARRPWFTNVEIRAAVDMAFA